MAQTCSLTVSDLERRVAHSRLRFANMAFYNKLGKVRFFMKKLGKVCASMGFSTTFSFTAHTTSLEWKVSYFWSTE